MREVAIIGVGMTEFGEIWQKSFRDLVAEAGIKAILDAGIEGDSLEVIFVQKLKKKGD